MEHHTLLCWMLLGVTALVVGISKTGFPGMGILAVPLAAVAIAVDMVGDSARLSTGFLLPMLIAGDVLAVIYWRRKASWGHLAKVIPCAVVGVIAGYLLMKFKLVWSDRVLAPVIGLIVLAMLGIGLWRKHAAARAGQAAVPQGWWFPITMGLAGGVTTLLGNAAGPIMTLYLLGMALPKEEFLGTGAWFFLLVNCFKVPFMVDLGLINGSSTVLNLTMLPVLILAAVAGIMAAKRISEKKFTWIVESLAVLGALVVAVKPFVSFSH